MLRQLGVLIVGGSVLLLGWGAAGAATSDRAAFSVTLTATLTKDWTVTRSSEGDCVETTTAAGHWKLTLTTRRPSRIAFAAPHGRRARLGISPSVVRGIAGAATKGGTVRTTSEPRCGPRTRTRTCATRRAKFRNARARLTTPRARVARFARLRGAGSARWLPSSCPAEPEEVRSLRTDLDLADAPLDASDVFGRDVARFFISGSSSQVTTIEGDYGGRAVERVRWRLTFTRVR